MTLPKGMRAIAFSLLILQWLIPASAHSQEALRAEASPGLFEHWNAFRSDVHEHGLVFETINTLDVLSTVSGGRQQKTAAAGNVDLLLTVDGQKLFDWDEATFFLYGLGLYGKNPSDHVGDIQSVSSIAAPNTWKLFEAWYQQNFLKKRVSLLAGLYDVTSEFDVIQSASELFLNGSFGTGPEFANSGENGPSTFPDTSLSLRGQAFFSDTIAVRAVIADGVPGDPNGSHGTEIILNKKNGIFAATEMVYYTFKKLMTKEARKTVLRTRPLRLVFQRVGRAAPVEYQGKYAVGLWGYSTELNDLSAIDRAGNPVVRQGTYGAYGLIEHIVFREPQDPDQHLTFFARVGYADPRVNRLSQYYGGGLVYRGLIPGRDVDGLGMGLAVTRNSSHFTRARRRTGQSTTDSEIALEFTYALNVGPELVLQPDVQYIINPDTNPAVQNAFVLGIRVQLNLSWFEERED